MSDTVIVALITLVASIGSTSITTYLRNKHEIKLKKIDLESSLRQTIINDFIDITLNCGYNDFSICEFYKSLNKLVYLVDEHSSQIIGKIKKLVEDGSDIKVINPELLKLTMYLKSKHNIQSIK